MEQPYVRELESNRLGLRFSNRRVESEYQIQSATRHSNNLRFQLLLSVMLISGICLLDFHFFEQAFANVAITMRLGAMLPPILLMIVLTSFPDSRKYLQAAGVATGLAMGLASLAIYAIAARYDVPQVFAGYQIVTVFVYFFLGLHVSLAIVTGTSLFIAYVALASLIGADVISFAYNSLFLFFLNIVGTFGCYQLSKARRTVFLEERILNYRANHDALTKIPNRRAFDTMLESAWEDATARSKSISLLMMDIDYFKNFNDLYGHQTGDDAIRQVGEILGKSLQRPQDFAGRYGGEEFVILLYDSTKAYAMELAETIRKQMLEKNIVHGGSSVAPCVSLSIGLAHLDPSRSSRSMKGFLQMADEALYTAKKNGRNRVVDADRCGHVTSTGMFHVSELEEPSGMDAALAAVGKN